MQGVYLQNRMTREKIGPQPTMWNIKTVDNVINILRAMELHSRLSSSLRIMLPYMRCCAT